MLAISQTIKASLYACIEKINYELYARITTMQKLLNAITKHMSTNEEQTEEKTLLRTIIN